MPFVTVPDFVAGNVVTETQMDTLGGNETYLFNGRPNSVIKRDNGASYTTTSATFTNIDGTNLTVTMTISSGKALVTFQGVCLMTGGTTYFDFTVDGTRYGSAGADGLTAITSTSKQSVGFTVVVSGLSDGSHTFTLQWKVTSGQTATLYSGNGVATEDFIVCFDVIEVG